MLGVEIGAACGVDRRMELPSPTTEWSRSSALPAPGPARAASPAPPPLACRICSQMLMTESSAVNEEVLDAVAELTNMIIGSVKTDLESISGRSG